MGSGITVKTRDLTVNDTVTNSSPKSIHYSGGGTDSKQNKKYVDNQCEEKSLLEKGNG